MAGGTTLSTAASSAADVNVSIWVRDSILRRFAIAIAIAAATTACVLLNVLADSLIGVSLVGASRLAGPFAAFAEAARRFGADPKASPMPAQGPSEMQLAIASFNTMQSQIQRFVAGQAAMFAAISHDLRTPLTRLRLRGQFIEDADQQARLFRDVDEMETMIAAVLTFLRDNAGGEETTYLELAELLRSIGDDYADVSQL